MKFCLHYEHTTEVKLPDADNEVVWVHNEHQNYDISSGPAWCMLINTSVIIHQSLAAELMSLHQESQVKVFYSDYKVNKDSGTAFLPDWSPERFLWTDYLGPILVVSPNVVSQLAATMGTDLGKMRTHILLDLVSSSQVVARLEGVHYESEHSWTLESNSRASQVQQYLDDFRPGTRCSVKSETYIEVSNADLAPSEVSLVIPTRGQKEMGQSTSLIENCILSLQTQDLSEVKVQVVVVYDNSGDLDYLDALRLVEIPGVQIQLVDFNEKFNFSRKCNVGAQSAQGDVVIFLNDDTLWISPNGLRELAGTASLPGVGAVGARLYFNDGHVQHAGYCVRDGFVRHAYIHEFQPTGSFGDVFATHEVLGVTGACLAVSRSTLHTLGTWDESFPASFNDVDYCLRFVGAGLRNMQCNLAELTHFESRTRIASPEPQSREIIKARWGSFLANEMYFRQRVSEPEKHAPKSRRIRTKFVGLLDIYHRGGAHAVVHALWKLVKR